MNTLIPLLPQTAMQPVTMDDKHFLHLNDADQAYIVTRSMVHLFCWVFKDGQPTSRKHYIGSFGEGDILLGGVDYSADATSCCFYVILDHDARLCTVNSQDLLALDPQVLGPKIDDYLDRVSHVLAAPTVFAQKQALTSGPSQTCETAGYFIASPAQRFMWVTPHEQASKGGQDGGHNEDNEGKESSENTENSAGKRGTESKESHLGNEGDKNRKDDHKNDLPPPQRLVSETIPLYLETGQGYDSYATADLLAQNQLSQTLKHFDAHIKTTLHQQLKQSDQARQDHFTYLQDSQNAHVENTFNQLLDSYHGHQNITPESIVLDESLGINRLIEQLCRLFDMPIKANAAKIIEKQDYNDWHQLEYALGIYKIRSRKVNLDEDWYRQENWVMLSRLRDTGQTILLKHNGRGYQYYDARANQWIRVNKSNVDTIDRAAYMLYRSLPEQPIETVSALFRASLSVFRNDLWFVVLSGIVIGITNLATPVLMGRLLSGALPSNNLGLIYSYLLAMLAAAIGVGVFRFVNSISVIRIESKSLMDIHASIWSRLLQLPISFFDKYSVGDLSDRANMIESIYASWSAAVTSAILSIFSILTVYALLFYYSPTLALASLLLLLLIVGVIYWFYTAIRREIYQLYHYKGILDNVVFQMLSSIHKLRIAAKENTILALWANVYNKVVVNNRKYMLSNAIMQTFFQALPLLASIMIFSFTYYFLFNSDDGNFNFGDFISFNTAFGQLTAAFVSISAVLSSIIVTKPMVERIMPILQAEVEASENKVIIESLQGDVEIKNVSFRYTPELPMTLNNLSLSIKSGEYIALVGASGSGKSTLLRLLMGFERAQSGSILIDGLNIQEIELSSLRKHIGIVLQNGTMMPGSIMENITLGSHTLSEDDVWHALALAGIEKEVRDMPMGLHTIVSENGANVSGGQLQRLIIARALVNKPNLMFLDEATNAMDNIVQRLVQETLESMSITRIVVAHRLSTITNVDRIYVMEKGQIVESGSYDELMERKQYFYRLVQRQQQ